MQTECLVRNESHDVSLEINVRFLQPLARETGEQIWLEAIEREVKLGPVSLSAPNKHGQEFTFPSARTIDGTTVRRNEMICGRIELQTHEVDQAVSKITVRIFNETPVPADRVETHEEVIMRTFASTHTVLHATGGEFISLLDPDPHYENAAKAAAISDAGRCWWAMKQSTTVIQCCRPRLFFTIIRRLPPKAQAIFSTAPRSTKSSLCASRR
jgi:hypothetical protein